MRVRSIGHKGLRRLYEANSSKGFSADTADKLRKMSCAPFLCGKRTL